ncbi:hypothetical protein F9U42_16095 [Pectobacterium versatile]|uniref:hypothetical protein n=1 Tax=Pectobacterium versatile TaxID=2488639 RepID=UPI001B3871B8|nr:hypothetical protein [Pectobacterium versatile]MBQ4768661.1 hypothetical protein [Pectobacterium versatile]
MRRQREANTVTAMRSCAGKYISPAQNGVRQFMRAGRPYCLAHGGNVAAGRHAKTPNVNSGTPSHATRDYPL